MTDQIAQLKQERDELSRKLAAGEATARELLGITEQAQNKATEDAATYLQEVEHWTERAEAAEAERDELHHENELLLAELLPLRRERDKAETAYQRVAAELGRKLDALDETDNERDRLMAALEKIADFAPGNGDVCEIIAHTAREALNEAATISTAPGVSSPSPDQPLGGGLADLIAAERIVRDWWDSCADDARVKGLTWEWDALSPLMTGIANALNEAATPPEMGLSSPSPDQPLGGGAAGRYDWNTLGVEPDGTISIGEGIEYLELGLVQDGKHWPQTEAQTIAVFQALKAELTALRDVAEAVGKAVEQADLVDEPDSHPDDMRLAIINIGDWLHAALDALEEAGSHG